METKYKIRTNEQTKLVNVFYVHNQEIEKIKDSLMVFINTSTQYISTLEKSLYIKNDLIENYKDLMKNNNIIIDNKDQQISELKKILDKKDRENLYLKIGLGVLAVIAILK